MRLLLLLAALAALTVLQSRRLRRLQAEVESAWGQYDDLEARWIDMRMQAYREGQTA